jgi:malonyl-CoA/methylmalonyl-CoA synthetase
VSTDAVVAGDRAVSVAALSAMAHAAAERITANAGWQTGARAAIFVPPGPEWLAALLGIWEAGGVAVPLAISHPPAELEYALRDSSASMVLIDSGPSPGIERAALSVGIPVVRVDHEGRSTDDRRTDGLKPLDRHGPAMILYTSGTTGKPKGVVLSHENLRAQVASLHEAWAWTSDDRALLVLPLHHVHGIVNIVLSALWAGAGCEMPPRFEAAETWDRLASGAITVFSAVPTIYHRLIAAWDAAPESVRRRWSDGARGCRLMMSGSAALPVSVLARWREITGHTLLERYGMTEIGMGLSNPLRGDRRPGFVGTPLPGVTARLVDDSGQAVGAGAAGELEIQGPGVFAEYWQRPEETVAAFRDGWFRTGDVAVVEDGAYRLMGRTSTDILKTGGHKISALEIEEVIRCHPAVADCAVVGLPDDEWGERVAVAIELSVGETLELDELQRWARPHLAVYKLPRALRTVSTLPRNAMGKVVKPHIARLFESPV